MKSLTLIFLAGILYIGPAFAQRNDGGAEERFRMKLGRNTPLEEARNKASNALPTSSERPVKPTKAQSSDFGAEERFRQKLGRNTPKEEARQAAANAATADRTTSVASADRRENSKRDDHGANERFRMKYGRDLHLSAEPVRSAAR